MPEIKTDYEYWLMTQLFVYLHDDKDYCHEENKKIDFLTDEQLDNLEKEMNEKNSTI